MKSDVPNEPEIDGRETGGAVNAGPPSAPVAAKPLVAAQTTVAAIAPAAIAPAASCGHEIVIARSAYDAAIRRQLRNVETYAVGSFRWQETISGRQLLVEALEPVRGVPGGASRPPMDSYLVMRVENEPSPLTASGLLDRVQPLRSHFTAAMVIHTGPPARWDACLHAPNGARTRVDAVTVQGPAPLYLTRASPADPPAADDRERWSRTAGALGDEVFARVRRCRVNVVGAGRNGTLCATMLAGLGVAQLRLIDGDTLEPHNQIGTLGLDTNDIGRSKAEALARTLHRQRPDLTLSAWDKSLLADDVMADLRRRPADLVLTSVDDDAARLAGWLLARSLLVPHLDVASAILSGPADRQLLGDVRLFVPGRGQGCPICVGGVGNLDDTLYALNAPAGALRRGEVTSWHDQRAGSLIGLNSLVVGAAMQLWLDYLSGRCRSSAWQRLRWQPGSGLQSNFAAVNSAATCQFCG
jgi:molybdopterin/thiamine biosynthesis adenylyltransferase